MNQVVFFWTGIEPILRIIVVGTITYFGIILILRVSGKRTLASMNAFDFIVTIAMGSAFGRILTAKQVSVSESLATFLLLVLLQYIVSSFASRSGVFARLFSSGPTLLFYNGQFLEDIMRKKRIRKDNVVAAVRKKQIGSLSEVEAIVLESDGKFSVVKKSSSQDESTVKGYVKIETPLD